MFYMFDSSMPATEFIMSTSSGNWKVFLVIHSTRGNVAAKKNIWNANFCENAHVVLTLTCCGQLAPEEQPSIIIDIILCSA